MFNRSLWSSTTIYRELVLSETCDRAHSYSTNRENYLHRIGRSGRFGRKGVAINFTTLEDIRVLRDIEQFFSTQIGQLSIYLN
jgi:hypothetical protein